MLCWRNFVDPFALDVRHARSPLLTLDILNVNAASSHKSAEESLLTRHTIAHHTCKFLDSVNVLQRFRNLARDGRLWLRVGGSGINYKSAKGHRRTSHQTLDSAIGASR